MRLGIVAAVRPELKVTLKALRATTVRIAGKVCYESSPFVFAIAGMGPENAERAALALADHARPDALVSTGFVGALDPELKAGDLVLGGSSGMKADAGLLRFAREAAPDARVGETLMLDRVLLDDAGDRSALRAGGAVAVDMESAAVGRAARGRRLDFLCVKVVLDTVAEPLASRYESVWKVLGEIVRRPRVLARIGADASRARRGAQRLAEFYSAFAARLC